MTIDQSQIGLPSCRRHTRIEERVRSRSRREGAHRHVVTFRYPAVRERIGRRGPFAPFYEGSAGGRIGLRRLYLGVRHIALRYSVSKRRISEILRSDREYDSVVTLFYADVIWSRHRSRGEGRDRDIRSASHCRTAYRDSKSRRLAALERVLFLPGRR